MSFGMGLGCFGFALDEGRVLAGVGGGVKDINAILDGTIIEKSMEILEYFL